MFKLDQEFHMIFIKKFEDLEDLIINMRGQNVLLDADVAKIYENFLSRSDGKFKLCGLPR